MNLTPCWTLWLSLKELSNVDSFTQSVSRSNIVGLSDCTTSAAPTQSTTLPRPGQFLSLTVFSTLKWIGHPHLQNHSEQNFFLVIFSFQMETRRLQYSIYSMDIVKLVFPRVRTALGKKAFITWCLESYVLLLMFVFLLLAHLLPFIISSVGSNALLLSNKCSN